MLVNILGSIFTWFYFHVLCNIYGMGLGQDKKVWLKKFIRSDKQQQKNNLKSVEMVVKIEISEEKPGLYMMRKMKKCLSIKVNYKTDTL